MTDKRIVSQEDPVYPEKIRRLLEMELYPGPDDDVRSLLERGEPIPEHLLQRIEAWEPTALGGKNYRSWLFAQVRALNQQFAEAGMAA